MDSYSANGDAQLLTLVERILTTPAALLVVLLLIALLLRSLERPAPAYTVVTFETPREAAYGGSGCLPLLVLVLVVLLAVAAL